MFCSPESLREFYDACQKYVDSHADYFDRMIGLIEDSSLSKKIYEARPVGTPVPPVLRDWAFASWSTDRLGDLMSARAKAPKAELKDAYDAWYVLSADVLVPIRIVWNMITAMSLTASGVPPAVYERLSSGKCLETMLYTGLRNYVSLSRRPSYTDWATRMVDNTLFRLDPERVAQILEHTVFTKFRYSMDKTVSLPVPGNGAPKMVGSSYSQGGDGIRALFGIMRMDVFTQTWNSYIRTDVIRSSLLMNPEVLILRERLRRWATRKNVSSCSMTASAWLSLTNATGREGSKAFLPSMDDEELDAQAVDAMNRLESISVDERGFESWRDMLGRCLADFLAPAEPSSNKRARSDE